MKISLENIGKIQRASIELNGITVIAGENNTGKSTIGKALFCIFNSFYDLKREIIKERKKILEQEIRYSAYKHSTSLAQIDFDYDKIYNTVLSESDKYLSVKHWENFKNLLLHNLEMVGWEDTIDEQSGPIITREVVIDIIERWKQILEVSDEEIFARILQMRIGDEFHNSINSNYEECVGKINLMIKGNDINITLQKNRVTSLSGIMELRTQAIYIDDPFVLDELNEYRLRMRRLKHRDHLKMCLMRGVNKSNVEYTINEIIADKSIKQILDKFDNICNLEMRLNDNSRINRYLFFQGENPIFAENISTGLKSFIILKELLRKGELTEKGVLILDEPEVHLHPQWQLIFAEIIVLVQKKFNMHVLLNTHSPYFLKAIEVYSAKHEVADRCKYYLSDLDGKWATIEDVTTKTEEIYKKLVLPFEILQEEIYGND